MAPPTAWAAACGPPTRPAPWKSPGTSAPAPSPLTAPRNSGIGREFGTVGLGQYVEYKTIAG